MAERRMIAKTITLSDAFLEMPATARCLYFTLLQSADDDGFVNNPRSLMRLTSATDDDMKILLAKKFVLIFDNGVIVIKHWRIHNLIRSDRYMETKYKDEKARLELDENNAYRFMDTNGIQAVSKLDTNGIPNGYQVEPQDSIGKYSIGKDNIYIGDKAKRFTPPTYQEICAYAKEMHLTLDANRFIDFYESKGWYVGKNKMKDWKAAVRNWSRREEPKGFSAAEEMQTEEVDLDELKAKMFGGGK